MAGYAVVFGAWLPDPSGTRLPPGAHIGPVGRSWHWPASPSGPAWRSRARASAPTSTASARARRRPFALVGAALGFGLGFATWNPLYLAGIAEAPVTWLPRHLGYAGSLVAGLGVLAGLACGCCDGGRPSPAIGRCPDPLHAVFVARWPTWLGGLAVGAIGTLAYLRLGPLGVTAELGGRSRQGAAALGLLPDRLEGLDGFRGCATALRDGLLTPNGLFVGGLVVASFAAALAAGQFRPVRPERGHVLRGLSGGILLGWGAMTGLGCSIGTLLSGIMAARCRAGCSGSRCLPVSP